MKNFVKTKIKLKNQLYNQLYDSDYNMLQEVIKFLKLLAEGKRSFVTT